MFSDSNLQKLLGKNFKYFYLLKFRFKSATAYKFDTYLWFCGSLLELLGLVFVWYLNNQTGSTLNFPQIFTYLVIGRIIDSFTSVENVFWFGNQLAQNRGDTVRILMFPGGTNGVFLYLMAKHLGSNLFYSIVNVFWLTILVLVFNSWIILPTNFVNLLWLLPFIILTFFIKFFLNFCIGMIALWTTESGGIWNLFNGINRILSGSMFPLNLYFLTSFALLFAI